MRKKKVIVTGACGFAGRYMCEYLCNIEDKPEVIGTDIITSESKVCDVFYKIDLVSGIDTAELIKKVQPDYVIHLAGTFGTNDSQGIYMVNVLSATALLEAIRQYKSDAVIIMAGSAAEYGKITAEQLPVAETMPCQPVTAYGLSKLLATQIALYYYKIYNLNVMIVRPFQLIGKGVTARLAPGAFAEQIKGAISDKSNIIKVGNLESSRDFLDIRDAARAVWMLCQKSAAGAIFNLCSGTPTKMADLLDMMISVCNATVRIEIDSLRLRSNDVSAIYGSHNAITVHCGWRPNISLEQSVQELLVV